MIDQVAARSVGNLSSLPIDVVEAMYSPDFIELASIGPSGLATSLPMSFTLDVPGNAVRFSSPATATRLTNYERDPRCSVLFSRVTAGHPPVLLHGVVRLGDVLTGVQRGPARQFTVQPWRVTALGDDLTPWQFAVEVSPFTDDRSPASQPGSRTATPAAEITDADLDRCLSLPSTILTLRDADGWPVAMPVDAARADGALRLASPFVTALGGQPGRAALLSHTWSKDGPRYLAFTGTAEFTGEDITFVPRRVLRRGL